jgi:hypothetical protein
MQYYSGSTAHPTFIPGIYPGQTNAYTSQVDTVTITAVPEPAAWALMLTGVLSLGAVLRARRGKVLAAA